MKRVIYLFVGILTLVFAASCSESDDPVIVDPAAELVDVSFDVQQFLPDAASKDGDPKGDQTGVVQCVENVTPGSVDITISGTDYTLDLVTINDGMETEVLKLPKGTYTIDSFVVMATDGTTPIYASPMEGSYYELLWSLEGVQKGFTVAAFDKMKVEIDVLCYQPYSYEEFGFAWFQYAKYEIKTICFYGDICTKYFDEWHADLDGNPYAGQDYDGYDFPAIFEVVVRDGDNAVNDLTINSNEAIQGIGEPLCVEYPDLIGVDENFTFEIWLHMPDGEKELIHSADLVEGISSEQGNDDGFGGADGVFDFVVGNCSYDGNDADLILPAWVPVPTERVSFKISNPGPGEEGYVRAKFDFLTNPLAAYGDLVEGIEFPMWCAEQDALIFIGQTYTADVYSTLGLGASNPMPASLQALPWGKLNWVMNHKDGFTTAQVQAALWYLIHGAGHPGAASVAGLTDAAIAGWQPTVGDWAILAFDADTADLDVQLMIVRVDP